MAGPVTLDFSKAQPIASSGSVTLDFSKAQPIAAQSPDTNTETFPDHATISPAPSPDNPLVKGVKGVGRFLKNTFVDLPGSLINAYQDPTAAGELVRNVAYGQGEEQRKQ